MTTKNTFQDFFDDLEDPRVDRSKRYPLIEIIFVVVCGMVCGADSWRDFVIFGESKSSYLKKFFLFENGIPSKNTFSRVMSAIDPIQFKRCFLEWLKCFQLGAQEKIADKSNEITAIPELLKLLEIKGAIITIDAMGC